MPGRKGRRRGFSLNCVGGGPTGLFNVNRYGMHTCWACDADCDPQGAVENSISGSFTANQCEEWGGRRTLSDYFKRAWKPLASF